MAREATPPSEGQTPMEIDITEFMANAEPFMFSASAAELGQDAGRITWNNAKAEAADTPLLKTPEEFDEFRAWAAGFGAWSREEIAAWDADECNALLIQYISGNLREIESLCMGDNGEIDWQKVRRLDSEGVISGNIFVCDIAGHASEGRIFFYMGS